MNSSGWRSDFAGSPYFAGLHDIAGHFTHLLQWPEIDDLNHVAASLDRRNAIDLPLRFEVQEMKCGQRDYEAGIHASARVPTRRHNWHDFFNALIWLAWARTKAALNAAQTHALADCQPGRRGGLSDATTLFDESGLVLVSADAELPSLLSARRWREAFWTRRQAWRAARVYVFGHSLLEKSLCRQPGITGKCLHVQARVSEDANALPGWLDRHVAQAWAEGHVTAPKQLFPLPLQGLPGFDPANGEASYYDDTRVFRPMREGSLMPTSAGGST